jgi:uncharacterized lipoprotein YehR (DUF1307 family)
MKKLISMILALVLCMSLGCALVSCDEDALPEGTDATNGTEEATVGPEGISKEEWQEAIANDNFTNVTIEYVLETAEGEKQSHIVKITPNMVYRKMTATLGGEEYSQEYLFTEEEAQIQGKMFVDVFLSLLAERDNFVYDMENGVYNAPEEVSTTVEAGEGMTAKETMKNGQVKFSKNGSLETFVCNLTEAAYMNEQIVHEDTYSATWTFKNYGDTVITEEEAAIEKDNSDNSSENHEGHNHG